MQVRTLVNCNSGTRVPARCSIYSPVFSRVYFNLSAFTKKIRFIFKWVGHVVSNPSQIEPTPTSSETESHPPLCLLKILGRFCTLFSVCIPHQSLKSTARLRKCFKKMPHLHSISPLSYYSASQVNHPTPF